jgi:hypothetical protein
MENYREHLLKRLTDLGIGETAREREKFEQMDNATAGTWLAAMDTLESGFVFCEDDEREAFARMFSQKMVADSIRAFDGRLLLLEGGNELTLSDLGRALADFIAAAEHCGFSSLPEIELGLSSVTWPCLMLIKKLAEKDQS